MINKKVKFSTYTFGCKVNQAESASLANILTNRGYILTNPEEADFIIVNTCTVTEKADKDAYKLIRKLSNKYPDKKIILTGCLINWNKNYFKDNENILVILPNEKKQQIPEIIDKRTGGSSELLYYKNYNFFKPARGKNRTRVFFKIQDGCQQRCSYCIVPYVRGKEVSLPPDIVKKEIQELVEKRIPEIVLVGIHLGRYGYDLVPKTNLAELLQELLKIIPYTTRLRLSSIEPPELSKELIEIVCTHPNICKHLHIPIQSGSERILKLMNRNYKISQVLELINYAHQLCDNIAIGSDIMVGFPDESEKDFLDTYNLIEKLPFTYLHVFTFSKRPHTKAYSMKDSVPFEVKRERAKVLRALSLEKKKIFRKRMIGKYLDAVIYPPKNSNLNSFLEGLSSNYIKLKVKDSYKFINKRTAVKIIDIEDSELDLIGVITDK